MKIAIDCRGLRKKPSGIPNFIVSAINGLALVNPTWEFYLLSNESFNDELQSNLDKRDNIKVVIQPLRLYNQISFLWLIFKVKNILKKIEPDIYWAPAFLLPPSLPENTKSLVTVHDFVFKEHKNTMSAVNRLFFNLLHDRSIKQADMLWVNSFYTKNGIQGYFPIRKCENVFTGFFINTSIFKPTEITLLEKQLLLEKYSLQEKFILFVGTLEPRKNLTFLLSLMPDLANKGYSLLVIGAKGWGETHIKSIIEKEDFPKEKVIFAGFVSTEELVKIYNIAEIYISTSLNEGFGMPQLEAMACGCPVVSPHNSAMIEVVEGAGETVKTWNKKDWLATIDKVVGNRSFYINAGYIRVKNYERETVIRNLTRYIYNQIPLYNGKNDGI